MATPSWQAGKLYPPGSLVKPLTAIGTIPVVLDNPGFDLGNTSGWDFEVVGGGGAPSLTTLNSHSGTYNLSWDGSNGSGYQGGTELYARNQEQPPVNAGQVINANVQIRLSQSGMSAGRAMLFWYDEDGNEIVDKRSLGQIMQKPAQRSERWIQSNVYGIAPPGAVTVRGGFWIAANGSGDVRADTFTWNYAGATAPEGLIYRAVQATAGYSSNVEPNWPLTLGVQVIDNQVIWEAVIATRVVYKARPIMKSGPIEPNPWPTTVGQSISDGTISWEVVSLRIEDENCPNSKIVAICKMKVYAGAGDIVRYCATLNAQDWTSERDAGFLGTGLQQNGANDVTVLNVYRGNLVVMNATTFQQWQVDPDPALMSLLDTMEGIGSTHQKAAQPVASDLLYLASLGVRTIGISAATENLRAGDIGLPIDKLVQEAVRDYAPRRPISMYFPSSGQYWLIFGSPADADWPDGHSQVFVYTLNQVGQVGAWSRYVFPFDITYACQKGDTAYVRTADTVLELSEQFGTYDYFQEEAREIPFDAVIQWPWLDMGSPGGNKMMHGFDIVGYGVVEVEFGYDQSNPGVFTDPYEVGPDTLTGQPIMFPLTAPSYSVRLTYRGGQDWGFNAMNIYLDDSAP